MVNKYFKRKSDMFYRPALIVSCLSITFSSISCAERMDFSDYVGFGFGSSSFSSYDPVVVFHGNSVREESQSANKFFYGQNDGNRFYEIHYAKLGGVSIKNISEGDEITISGQSDRWVNSTLGVVHEGLKQEFTSLGASAGYKSKIGSFSPFMKIGVHFWEVDSTTPFSVLEAALKDNEAGLSYLFGLGLEYDLSENFSIRGEYEKFMLDGSDSIDTSSLGLILSF